MKNVNKSTLARTIVLVLALVNQVLAVMGRGTIDIAEETIYQAVSLACTIGMAFRVWWKNNDFTREAAAGTKYMHVLKMHRRAGDTIIEGGDGDVAEH